MNKGFLISLLVIFCSIVIFELIARGQFLSHWDIDKKYEIATQSPRAEILVLGSSQAEKSINPEKFEQPSINLAYNNQSLYYDLQWLKLLESKGKLPTHVLLGMGYFSLGYQADQWLVDHHSDYWWFAGFRSPIFESPLLFLYRSSFFRYRNEFFRSLLQRKQRPKSKPVLSKGTPRPSETGRSQYLRYNGFRESLGSLPVEELKSHAKRRSDLYGFQLYSKTQREQNTKVLESLLNYTQNKSIKITIFRPPFTRYYRSQFPDSIRETETMVLTELCENFDNCSFIDSNHELELTEEQFFDSDHLNAYGADSFTVWLRNKLKQQTTH